MQYPFLVIERAWLNQMLSLCVSRLNKIKSIIVILLSELVNIMHVTSFRKIY